MGPTRNELQLGAGQTMESFRSAQLTWELHKVLEDDDVSSKPDTGRVRRHSETTQVSDPFLILNIFPDFIPFPVSITFLVCRGLFLKIREIPKRGSSLMLSWR